jgi:hypothetical protein
MRPDDDRLVPFDRIGADPVLDALASELTAAGRRARSAGRETPRAAYATDLRARLLAGLPVVAPVAGPPLDRARPRLRLPEPLTARPVTPRIAARSPMLLPAPRWTALAIAAVVLVAVVGLGPTRLPTGPADLRAGDVSTATLSRDGVTSDLTPSEALRAGDLITTGPGGFATLELGASRVRLDGGTALRLVAATTARVELDQSAGRAWHRVGGPGVSYTVHTAEVSWTADGTAFDLRLETDPSNGGAWVRGIGIEHDVAITGPNLTAMLDEGAVARIRLGRQAGSVADVALRPVTGADLRDPWLIDNAKRDARLGFDPGVLDGWLAEASPTPVATTDPIAGPSLPDDPVTGSPEPAVTVAPPKATPAPTPKPTPRPTPRPTPTPKPTAKPTPALASLGLTATACPGGFTRLGWSVAPADRFNHYQSIRSSKTSIPAVYPPVFPGVAPDSLYVAERATLGAVDAGLEPGTTVSYRTMAFSADDVAYAASSVKTVTIKAVKALGALIVTPDGTGFAAGWTPYSGPDGCFGFYKLVVSTTDPTPSYLDGATAVWVGESAATASTLVETLDPPGTYHVRLEAILDTPGGKLLVAQTDVADITVP